MKDSPPKFVFNCPAEEISAYIDGELTAELEVALERHVGTCEICRTELNQQKGFLIALSDTLEREIPIDLPDDFTKSIVVNAESKVSGLRNRRERSTAVIVIALLVFLAVVAVGSVTGTFAPVVVAAEKLLALAGVVIQIAGDLTSAVISVARSLLNSQTFSTAFAYTALSLAVVLLLFFGSRSLRRYFRTPGT